MEEQDVRSLVHLNPLLTSRFASQTISRSSRPRPGRAYPDHRDPGALRAAALAATEQSRPARARTTARGLDMLRYGGIRSLQPAPASSQEDRAPGPLADGQVDRPDGTRRQRDGDDLAALSGDGQCPVPSLQAQVLEVGAGRFGDPQPVQCQQGHQACSVGGPSPAATSSAPSSLRSSATAWDLKSTRGRRRCAARECSRSSSSTAYLKNPRRDPSETEAIPTAKDTLQPIPRGP